jgi:hypothetical protein
MSQSKISRRYLQGLIRKALNNMAKISDFVTITIRKPEAQTLKKVIEENWKDLNVVELDHLSAIKRELELGIKMYEEEE